MQEKSWSNELTWDSIHKVAEVTSEGIFEALLEQVMRCPDLEWRDSRLETAVHTPHFTELFSHFSSTLVSYKKNRILKFASNLTLLNVCASCYVMHGDNCSRHFEQTKNSPMVWIRFYMILPQSYSRKDFNFLLFLKTKHTSWSLKNLPFGCTESELNVIVDDTPIDFVANVG